MHRDNGQPTRVASRDGTAIAYWTSGQGPPLVLVHGTAGDHTRWGPVLAHLERRATVHAVDRRGRGGSGDAGDWAMAREYEDVAAVVDDIAGGAAPVDVLGYAFGALAAVGAAALTDEVRRLVLFEPPVDPPPEVYSRERAERLEELLAAGEPEAAVAIFLREVVGLSEAQLEDDRARPAWQGRLQAAPTLPREYRAPAELAFHPAAAATVTVPTLLLVGADSPDWARADTETVAAALSNARISILEGQGHRAPEQAPELFADRVLGFLRGPL